MKLWKWKLLLVCVFDILSTNQVKLLARGKGKASPPEQVGGWWEKKLKLLYFYTHDDYLFNLLIAVVWKESSDITPE